MDFINEVQGIQSTLNAFMASISSNNTNVIEETSLISITSMVSESYVQTVENVQTVETSVPTELLLEQSTEQTNQKQGNKKSKSFQKSNHSTRLAKKKTI